MSALEWHTENLRKDFFAVRFMTSFVVFVERIHN